MKQDGEPNALELVREYCPADAFENAIRRVGVTWACEWFGHAPDSEFTQKTIECLKQRSKEQQ